MSKRMAEAILAGMIVCAVGCGGSNGGGGNGNGLPTPVKVLAPSSRPDLNINAILFSNGTAIGCNELAGAVPYSGPAEVSHAESLAKRAGPIGPPPELLSHEEPPIGGRDGSFQLVMPAQQNLAGSNPTTRKVCGAPHKDSDGDVGTWALDWKIWNQEGPVNSGSRQLDLPNLKDVSITVAFNDSNEKVTIIRSVDSFGSSWQAQSLTSTFTTTSGSDNDLNAPNKDKLRMKSLTIVETLKSAGSQPTSEVIPLAISKSGTCAAFVICHRHSNDANQSCPAIERPKDCSTGGVQGTTAPPTSH